MKAIGVDFDGVLHLYSRGWRNGEIYDGLVPGAAEGLRELLVNYTVFIFTTRTHLQRVADYITEHTGIVTVVYEDKEDLPVFWNTPDKILVTNQKLAAVAYVDDRAIRFHNWPQALRDLNIYDGNGSNG